LDHIYARRTTNHFLSCCLGLHHYRGGYRAIRIGCKENIQTLTPRLIFANRLLLFRFFVLTSAAIYVLSYLLPDGLFAATLEEKNLLGLDGYGAVFTPRSALFTIGVFALWLFASLGLIRLRNWARHLYLLLTVWAVVSAGLYGIRVSSPVAAVLDVALDLLDGVILAMAYLSSVKDLFVNDGGSGTRH
jgi:hypothetical protein